VLDLGHFCARVAKNVKESAKNRARKSVAVSWRSLPAPLPPPTMTVVASQNPWQGLRSLAVT